MAAQWPWIVDVACAAIYGLMAVYVWSRGPAVALNRVCAALIVCFAHWATCLAVAHHPASSLAVAARAYDVGAVAWASFASLALWFTITFARPAWLRRRWLWGALVAPPLAVIAAQWTGHLAAGYPHRPWGHAYRWQSSPAAFAFYLYYGVYMLTGLGLMLHATRSDDAIRRRQARIIALPALVPLALASLTDVWLPRAGVYALPNIAPDFTLVWVAGLVFAIVRYRALSLTPVAATERVVATMSEALLLVAPDQRVAWANPAADAMLGAAGTPPTGQPWARWFGDRPLQVGSDDVVATTAAGDRIELSLSIAELRDDLEQLVGHVVVAADISARKRAERALVAARDDLEARVAARTRELTELNQRLRDESAARAASEAQLARSERLTSLGVLANGICHEINNPLAAVLANLEAVRIMTVRGGGERDREELEAAAADAVVAAHRIRATVGNLRQFARESDVAPTIVDVEDVITDALRLLRHELWPRVEVERASTGPVPLVLVVASRLTQVFVNLVVALVGGGAPSGPLVRLRVATRVDGDRVRIALTAPTASGLAQRVLDGDGPPLGLAITHEMLASMGGALEFAGSADDVVTMTIALPARRLDEPALLPATELAPEPEPDALV